MAFLKENPSRGYQSRTRSGVAFFNGCPSPCFVYLNLSDYFWILHSSFTVFFSAIFSSLFPPVQ